MVNQSVGQQQTVIRRDVEWSVRRGRVDGLVWRWVREVAAEDWRLAARLCSDATRSLPAARSRQCSTQRPAWTTYCVASVRWNWMNLANRTIPNRYGYGQVFREFLESGSYPDVTESLITACSPGAYGRNQASVCVDCKFFSTYYFCNVLNTKQVARSTPDDGSWALFFVTSWVPHNKNNVFEEPAVPDDVIIVKMPPVEKKMSYLLKDSFFVIVTIIDQ